MSTRKKTLPLTVRQEVYATNEKCLAKGDFGYRNVYGSPYLCFDVRCQRTKGHALRHAALHTVHITPSYEQSGVNVVKESVEIQGEALLIRWQNNDDETSTKGIE